MSTTLLLAPGLWAHHSGALLLEASRTAVIADAHLGYSWAQRRRGELGPLADERTRSKLIKLAEEWHPRRFVFLGDLVHAPRPCAPERAWIEELLLQLHAHAEIVCVRGNHDRAFAREFSHLPVQALDQWEHDGHILALHGDRLPESVAAERLLLLGHVHPAIPVRDAAGAGRRLPVFLVTPRCILLPAFSPFAGGYDLLGGVPADLLPLFGSHAIETFAASDTRVVSLGPLRQALERMLDADTGTAKRFRRRA